MYGRFVDKKGFVYFFQTYCEIRDQWGAVKIGFSCYPQHRLSAVRSSSPMLVYPLAIVPGTPELEKSLHQRFKRNRIHGEWFSMDRELMRFIRDILRQESSMPDWIGGYDKLDEQITRGENACA